MQKNKHRLRSSIALILISAAAAILLTTIIHGQGNKKNLSITVLCDNDAFNQALLTEWGYSCLIKGAARTILFDIGSSMVLNNMETLKIDPASIDTVFLSHEHPDHTNGIPVFLKKNSNVSMYVPKSCTFYFKENIKGAGAKVVDVRDPALICENIYSTGEMGGDREQALAIRTARGLIVITGCAHPGVVNMVRKAKAVTGEEKVYLIMGGFHLLESSKQDILEIIRLLKEEKVIKVAPSHCTGDYAKSLFLKEYGDNFIPSGVGKEIKIEGVFLK